jgi:hypothetical protein
LESIDSLDPEANFVPISGPKKTARIAPVVMMVAQAQRTVSII